MATFTKVNDWVINLVENVDMASDAFNFDLSNTVPTAGTNVQTDTQGIQANITPISYTNYTDDLTADRVLTAGTVSASGTGGTYTFDYGADIVITASGGALASFQYIILYDDTVAVPVDPLIGWWDHGSAITLAITETATIAFNASGIFTLT